MSVGSSILSTRFRALIKGDRELSPFRLSDAALKNAPYAINASPRCAPKLLNGALPIIPIEET